MQTARQLQQLVTYVQRQWIDKRTVGPDRVSVRGVTSRTNNVLESYHAAVRRRIQVLFLSSVSLFDSHFIIVAATPAANRSVTIFTSYEQLQFVINLMLFFL